MMTAARGTNATRLLDINWVGAVGGIPRNEPCCFTVALQGLIRHTDGYKVAGSGVTSRGHSASPSKKLTEGPDEGGAQKGTSSTKGDVSAAWS